VPFNATWNLKFSLLDINDVAFFKAQADACALNRFSNLTVLLKKLLMAQSFRLCHRTGF
jgi:hypothetical protein